MSEIKGKINNDKSNNMRKDRKHVMNKEMTLYNCFDDSEKFLIYTQIRKCLTKNKVKAVEKKVKYIFNNTDIF